MVSFDPAHRAVHYPPDRRFRIWVRPSILIGIVIAIVFLIAAAWIEVVVAGIPHVPAVPKIYPNNFVGPHGFPLWVRYCHFFNFLSATGAFMVVLDIIHPPAGATTLIVSLGIISHPRELVVIEIAVFLLVAQALIINRLASVQYPLWTAISEE